MESIFSPINSGVQSPVTRNEPVAGSDESIARKPASNSESVHVGDISFGFLTFDGWKIEYGLRPSSWFDVPGVV